MKGKRLKKPDQELVRLFIVGEYSPGYEYRVCIRRILNNFRLRQGIEMAGKSRIYATHNGVKRSLVEWAVYYDISISSFRIKTYKLGIEKAIEYYEQGEHLKVQRGAYKHKKQKVCDIDLSAMEFDINLHAQRLIDHGFNYEQVASRMISAGLL